MEIIINMPEEFTNRELGMLIQEIHKNVDEMKEENILSHSRLDNNQRSTNGRVRNLEMWRQFLLGAWAVLSLATPIAWYMITQDIKSFREDISAEIVNAINLNNEKFFEVVEK